MKNETSTCGYTSLTSAIVVENADEVIASYQEALDAEVIAMFRCPKTDKVMHCCLHVGGASLFVCAISSEEGKEKTGRQEFYLYVDDVDDACAKAENAGWRVLSDPEEMLWGDRVGDMRDPVGNTWRLAQDICKLTIDEIESEMQERANAV